MAIRIEHVNDRLSRIFLSGRLDTAGSDEIAPQFAEVAQSAQGGLVVYLSAVTFLSSMAVRVLIAGAKAVQAKGGRMVLHVSENEVVIRTLEAMGIDEVIPTFRRAEDAEKAALK